MREDDSHTEDQYHDHMKRIDAIIANWKHGTIGTREKRRQITEENKAYYGKPFRSPANGQLLTSAPRLRDEMASVIAEQGDVPLEVASAALGMRRQAYADAACAATAEEARQLLADGARAYSETLAAAGFGPGTATS